MHFWILEGDTEQELHHKIASEVGSGAENEVIPLISTGPRYYGMISRKTVFLPRSDWQDEP